MIKELATNPFNDQNLKRHISQVLKYLDGKIETGTLLDVGQVSPLTEAIRLKFPELYIANTTGDLDTQFYTTGNNWKYDYILYSHTIEHQFNPLSTLLYLKRYMKPGGSMFIILPSRSKLLWTPGHFHEIDHYRMQLLLKRSGYEIKEYKRIKIYRRWFTYSLGIRMLLRLFFEFNAYYHVLSKTD